jgi:hypothetical protein
LLLPLPVTLALPCSVPSLCSKACWSALAFGYQHILAEDQATATESQTIKPLRPSANQKRPVGTRLLRRLRKDAVRLGGRDGCRVDQAHVSPSAGRAAAQNGLNRDHPREFEGRMKRLVGYIEKPIPDRHRHDAGDRPGELRARAGTALDACPPESPSARPRQGL